MSKLPGVRSHRMVIAALLVVGLSGGGARGDAMYLDIGSMVPKPRLGFGWGRAAMADGRPYRWIKHLEADIQIDIESPSNRVLTVRARPQFVPYTRQTVSILVNGTYVGEWVCADHPEYETYALAIPARYWAKGENRLTLRMAYRKQVGPDTRELSLCVDTVAIRPE